MNKNKRIFLSMAIMLLVLVCSIGVLSKSNDIKVNINGTTISSSTQPIINNGRVLVGMRSIFENMGATVNWNATTKTITSTRENTTIKLTLGSTKATVNGKTITLDVPAKSINSTTMIPTRFVAESFNAKVIWDSDKQLVDIKDYYDKLVVCFIDVGQGDAILLFHDEDAMLIDAGDNAYGDMVVNYIKNQGVTDIDYLVNTHPHADHLGGMDTVINKTKVNKAIINPQSYDSKSYRDVITALKTKGITTVAPQINATYYLGDAKCTILAPINKSYTNTNNYSIVIRVDHGDNSFLLTGDAEKLVENEILASKANIDVDVLKVGHHGSSTSTSQNYLNAVSPQYAIISLGANNRYGHPHRETLDKLTKYGCKIYRTDQNGSIVIFSNEKDLSITTEKAS